jgi:8-oxo-dGTP pyrophosphatase MutT (NUDIX family)
MDKPHHRLIAAAGGVVWHSTPEGLKVAVIHRPRYDDFALPKGKLDRGEIFEEAALREVLEEIGTECHITEFVEVTSYFVGKAPKIVVYFNMEPKDEIPFVPNDEVDQLHWLEPEEAQRKLSYQSEREVLSKATVLRCRERSTS